MIWEVKKACEIFPNPVNVKIQYLAPRCSFVKNIIQIFLIGVVLSSCSQKDPVSMSNMRMIPESLGQGPWRLVTYSGERVTRDTVMLDGGEVVIRSSSVYVSKDSQFVLMDGKPITIFTGDHIFWNADGHVITSQLYKVPESIVFSVNGDPMPNNTALTLFDYSPVRENKL